MSGVFGVIDTRGQVGLQTLVSRMAQAMSRREWYVAEHMIDDERRIGLGRIGIGIFNQGVQPVWNTDRTVALVMAGEFYDVEGMTDIETVSHEETALSLYEARGIEFVKGVKGVFIIGIWDVKQRRLSIVNDRFGLYPLYYNLRGGRLIFAPEMKGILCDETFPKKLDLTALPQYMRFQHLLGERTFFEDITLLPKASILEYDVSTGQCQIKAYWTYNDILHRPKITFDEAVEESERLLRQSVLRLSGDNYRPGVYLSGGLDSRTILGLVEQRPVASLTYGIRNCRDVYYAQKIARRVESEHHWIDLPDGQWVKEYADFHLELTEGFHSWIHAHGISTLAQAREIMDVNLTGWDGGTVMGDDDTIEPLQLQAVDDQALTARMFYLFTHKYTWPSLNEAEKNLLFTDTALQEIQACEFESFREEFEKYLDYRPDVRSGYFYIDNHCRRLTFNMITFTRSHVEVRFPFFDYDLFDFLYSIPATMRADKNLFRSIIRTATPKLAYIPYDHDELLPIPPGAIRKGHILMVKLRRRFNRYVWPISSPKFTLYADYENYLRHSLKSWAENILFDAQVSDRNIWNVEAIKSLWARHQSGLEIHTIGKLAPIMTYEMMLRKFYDS